MSLRKNYVKLRDPEHGGVASYGALGHLPHSSFWNSVHSAAAASLTVKIINDLWRTIDYIRKYRGWFLDEETRFGLIWFSLVPRTYFRRRQKRRTETEGDGSDG